VRPYALLFAAARTHLLLLVSANELLMTKAKEAAVMPFRSLARCTHRSVRARFYTPFFYRPRINKTAAFYITPARAPLCISEKEIDINLQIAFSSFAPLPPPPQKRAWHFSLSLSFSLRAAGLLNFKISLFHSNTHIHSVSTRESFLLCIQPCAGAVRDLIKSFAQQRA
jgi:hypothetical protein